MSDGELAWTTENKPLRSITVNRNALRDSVHPTQKPVEVMAFAIKYLDCDGVVLDLFGGSGSTLIAAQETNRVAYLMELDPHYVDVICARYQKHTGNQPILEATGETHDFTPDAD
jgi:DNA modification methylase